MKDYFEKKRNWKKHEELTQLKKEVSREKLFKLEAWDRFLRPPLAKHKIIHGISCLGSATGMNSNSPFLTKKVEDLFACWDVISTSCVDIIPENNYNRMLTGILDVHLDLQVPKQNILGTFPEDVWFPNFAGMKNNVPNGKCIDRFALADAVFLGQSKNMSRFKPNTPYNTLEYPKKLIDESYREKKYNEILVIGKPGVRLYDDLPPTGRIKLNSISLTPTSVEWALDDDFDDFDDYFDLLLGELSKNGIFKSELDFIVELMAINSLSYINIPHSHIYPNINKEYKQFVDAFIQFLNDNGFIQKNKNEISFYLQPGYTPMPKSTYEYIG